MRLIGLVLALVVRFVLATLAVLRTRELASQMTVSRSNS